MPPRSWDRAIGDAGGAAARGGGAVAAPGAGVEPQGDRWATGAGAACTAFIGGLCGGALGVITSEGRWMAAVLASGPERCSAIARRRASGDLLPPGVGSGRSDRPSAELGARRAGSSAARLVCRGRRGGAVDGIPVTSVSRTMLRPCGGARASAAAGAGLERDGSAAAHRIGSRCRMLLERYPGRRGLGALRALLGGEGAGRDHAQRLRGGVRGLRRRARPAAAADERRPRRCAVASSRSTASGSEQRLSLELDGREPVHGTAAPSRATAKRDRILLAEGWRATARHLASSCSDEPAAGGRAPTCRQAGCACIRDGGLPYP